MICIQMPGAAVFFPDDEITEAKAITSMNAPAIAFKSLSTGGLQFIKRYQSVEERDREIGKIAASGRKEPKEDMTEKLMERIRVTEEELEKMRKAQKPARTAKPAKPKKKREKKFVPPTNEEIIAYIKEKHIDEKLNVPAEILAESFRNIYESDEPTGEKDGNGCPAYKWKKADGTPVLDWKGCMRTFKARQLVFNAKKQTGKQKQKPRQNQFNQFEQNQYSDEELEEIENSSVT